MRSVVHSIAVCTAALFFIALPTRGDTLRVPADYPTIFDAIRDTNDGDVVLVSPGTYIENIRFQGRAILVKSTDGPEVTIIDGNQAGATVSFKSGEGPDSVLEGFTVRNGSGRLDNGSFFGGGVLVFKSSPTIIDNIITANSVEDFGGGISCTNSSPRITNNQITGNLATEGGGIYCSGNSFPLITNNLISENTASIAGGIHCISSSPVIVGNMILENTAVAGHGGGISCESGSFPSLTNNTISQNNATDFGGGIYVDGTSGPTISNNQISSNRVAGANFASGGGICCMETAAMTISQNMLTGNEAEWYGGGIYAYSSGVALRRNRITDNLAFYGGGIAFEFQTAVSIAEENNIAENVATANGGGIYCFQSSPRILNNLLFGNDGHRGGGLFCTLLSSPSITNNTIVSNSADSVGGGIYCGDVSSPAITNSIVWANAASSGSQIQSEFSQPIVQFSDIQGGWSGLGNINLDPLFVNAASGDFHLKLGSPCIDRGNNNAPSLPNTDFEGDARIVNGQPDLGTFADMGADELRRDIAVRFGNVNAANGLTADVLFMNGIRGDRDRVFSSTTGRALTLTMGVPPAGPAQAGFVLYAWLAAPQTFTLTEQPANLGFMSFSTPLNGGGLQPFKIWNNLGHRPMLGHPNFPSQPAPSVILDLPDGVGLPATVTFQGFIEDFASTADGPGSITNAIVVIID